MAEQDGAANKQRGRGPGKRFQPGQSGNPRGRPKLGESLAEVLRQKWPPDRIEEAISNLALSATSDTTRLAALQLIIERAHGRVPHNVDLDVVGVGPEAQAMLGALALTPHQRRERLAELQRLAVGTKTARKDPPPQDPPSADADD